MGTWLEGFERPAFRHAGGTYVGDDSPPRLILHTTEGGSVESNAAVMSGTGNYSHIVADPAARRAAQLVDLDRSATATKNRPGGVQTNRLNAVQVEIVWRAAEIRNLTSDELAWLGTAVVAPICKARGIQPVGPPRPFVGPEAGFIARPDAPQRMTYLEWARFNGVCGHQHVPENDHWDPGALDIDTVLAAARKALGHTTEEPHMANDSRVVLVFPINDRGKPTKIRRGPLAGKTPTLAVEEGGFTAVHVDEAGRDAYLFAGASGPTGLPVAWVENLGLVERLGGAL